MLAASLRTETGSCVAHGIFIVQTDANLPDNSDKAAFSQQKDSCAGFNRKPIHQTKKNPSAGQRLLVPE